MSDNPPQDPELLCKALYLRGLSRRQVVRQLRAAGVAPAVAAHLAAKQAARGVRVVQEYRWVSRVFGLLLVLGGLVPWLVPGPPRWGSLGAMMFCLLLGIFLIVFPDAV